MTKTKFTPDQFDLLGHLLYVAVTPTWTIEQRIKYVKKRIREHHAEAKFQKEADIKIGRKQIELTMDAIKMLTPPPAEQTPRSAA